ncbi:MAG: GntR family transcriptional regulator [Proteiniphilum sp.]|nr:GntR family transcriptional regulator [Proteiniphilum sp.]
MIDRSSNTPLHKQAEQYLRELIVSDKYKNGKLIPNEVELSEQLRISRNTLRQAINKLVNEGLLIRKRGIGTRVAINNIYSEANNWLSFSQEMKVLGIKVENFELHISKQKASSEARSFFTTEDKDQKVLKIERLRGKEDFPFVYFVSEFNPAIPLDGTENFNEPLYDILKNRYNIIVKSSREEISAIPANEFLASKLDVEEGSPILVRKRFVSDIEGVPIEFNIGWYRADSFTYKIESTRRELP